MDSSSEEICIQLIQNMRMNLLRRETPVEPRGLAGCWYVDTRLDFRVSSNPACAGFSRLPTGETEKICPALLHALDFWERKCQLDRCAFVIDEDLSKAILFKGGEKTEEWFLNGEDQSCLSWLCPWGLLRCMTTYCSQYQIRWQMTLPGDFGTMCGSLELTSDMTSLVRYETTEGQQVVSWKLRRFDNQPATCKSSFAKISTRLRKREGYMPSLCSVPEDYHTTEGF